MASYDPRAIANEFIKLNVGTMRQMKLQKLVYMAHGWNLAIHREPLVKERIEAWDGGPVMRSIWNQIRDYGFNAKGYLMGDAKGKPYKADLQPKKA